MTYCVAIAVDAGIVFCSDSRTSAGVDQTSTYSKMHRFGIDSQRQFVLLTAGNLATSQGVVKRIKRDIRDGAQLNLLNAPSFEDAAEYIGQLNVEQQEKTKGGQTYEASFVLGGQINGSRHEALLIYPQGNFISSSDDTVFLQIGESKYGKPMLDRVVDSSLSLESGARLALISLDATIRSNVTVGPPFDLAIYRNGAFRLDQWHRFDFDSPFYTALRSSWQNGLTDAFGALPMFDWETADAQSPGT